MFSITTTILLLSVLAGATTFIGVLLAGYIGESKKRIATGLGFSTGLMVAISLLELVPEASRAAGKLPTILGLMAGFLLLFLLHITIPHIHMSKEYGGRKKMLVLAYLVAFGMVLHDFPEGFAMASSYYSGPALGLLISVSIALHNVPEGLAMGIPLLLAKKKHLLLKLAVLSAFATPLGAVLGLFTIHLVPTMNPLFLAFAAGAMIFISFNELLPLAEECRNPHCFLLGIGLGLLVYLALAMAF